MRVAGIDFETLQISGKANLLAIPRLAQAVRRHKIDVLHSHLSTASWWCGWLQQLGGPPAIGHVHGFTSALWHRRQTHLIACSGAVKQDLIAKGFSRRANHRDALPGRPGGHALEPLAAGSACRAWCHRRYAGRGHVRPPCRSKKAIASWCARRKSFCGACPRPNSGAPAKARCAASWKKRPASWVSPTASSSWASAAMCPT